MEGDMKKRDLTKEMAKDKWCGGAAFIGTIQPVQRLKSQAWKNGR
jgi:hypothetical protein